MWSELFSPLPKDYCLYFYYLSVIGFILFTLAIVSGVAFGIMKRKGFGYYVSVVAASIVYFLLYFVNRLLFSMCQR